MKDLDENLYEVSIEDRQEYIFQMTKLLSHLLNL